MASCSELGLCCPACHDVFKDPVLLSCSHSFCKACLERWWKVKQVQECPLCWTVCQWSHLPLNLALKNLCEVFLRDPGLTSSFRSAALCHLHCEKLKLFCVDHQQPACLVCRDAKIHQNHQFRPINEAARDLREELQKTLKPLQDKLKIFKEAQANFSLTAEHVKKQSERVEQKMKEQFKKLHQFLQEEEEARMAALREEAEQRRQVMKDKMAALSRDMAALSETVRATEEDLRAEDTAFLRNYQLSLERVQSCPLLDDPQLHSGALLDVAKHLGNLTFNIWSKMKDKVSYSPVILDPNTANPDLSVSEDLTSVRHGKRRRLPENPERFGFWDSVLGSEGFSSGTHSWDVEVGDNKDWELGVLAESVCRQGFTGSEVWSVEFSGMGYRAYSPKDKYTELSVRDKVKKVRVHLDWDEGRLSFSEPETNTHLHTFTHTFTKTLNPHLCTRDTVPLRVLPVRVSEIKTNVT